MTLSRGASGLWSGSRVDFFHLHFLPKKLALMTAKHKSHPSVNLPTPELQKILRVV